MIVVDDGSPDETYHEAAKLLSSQAGRVRIVQYDENQGKGNALMCGAWFARGDYVVFLDADMDLHPAQLPIFFEIMERTGADVVIGSKRHPLSKVNYPWIRRIYSAIYYAIIRLMFGLPVKDTQTGLKMFKREVLQRVFPRILVKRFAFDIEVLANAHRLGYKIVDAPVTLEFRRRFDRIKWRDIVAIMTDTLAIFYRMYILQYYDRLRRGAAERAARCPAKLARFWSTTLPVDDKISVLIPLRRLNAYVRECARGAGAANLSQFRRLRHHG